MFSLEKQRCMKVQIFDQNHRLTHLQKCKFFDFLKMPFYSLERLVFSLKHYLEVLPGVFSRETEMHKSSNFGPQSWVNAIPKCKFFDFF